MPLFSASVLAAINCVSTIPMVRGPPIISKLSIKVSKSGIVRPGKLEWAVRVNCKSFKYEYSFLNICRISFYSVGSLTNLASFQPSKSDLIQFS